MANYKRENLRRVQVRNRGNIKEIGCNFFTGFLLEIFRGDVKSPHNEVVYVIEDEETRQILRISSGFASVKFID